jgi:hypothetical protein
MTGRRDMWLYERVRYARSSRLEARLAEDLGLVIRVGVAWDTCDVSQVVSG